MSIKTEIITIGDEILYGQIIDTNAQWMSAYLDDHGIKTVHRTTIGDEKEGILKALKLSESRADVVLITGGLGPTKDDKTKETMAEYFGMKIVKNQEAFDHVKNLFESRGYEFTKTNEEQGYLPEGCEMITNHHGTAPCMWFNENNTIFVCMPGVPFEMKELMQHQVVPKILETLAVGQQVHQFIHTIGIGESWLSDILEEWEAQLPNNISLAYLPSLGQVKLRLSIAGEEDKAVLESLLKEEVEKIKPLIGKHVFKYERGTIEETIGEILKYNGKTLGTAESCTGGFIAHQLTSYSGSSSYFNGSIVSYSNDIKINTLGVPKELIVAHGAVSEEVVSSMAMNVLEKLDTDFSLATSGVAGPTGGTAEKPVGHIWIALGVKGENGNKTIKTKLLKLGKHRISNIRRTASQCFLMLWEEIK